VVEENLLLAVVFGSAVRRELAVHACQLICSVTDSEQIEHTDENRWQVLTRSDLYAEDRAQGSPSFSLVHRP